MRPLARTGDSRDTSAMWCSLLKIDIAGKDNDGRALYVQTDHRERDEQAAEPELSVLVALTRMINVRNYAAREQQEATVVYACMDEPIDTVREALAACGATLDCRNGNRRELLTPGEATTSQLADRAFAALAARHRTTTGLTDWAAALHALETETLADPPDIEVDEPVYWTRVLTLAALTGELLRAKHGGNWIEAEHADVPFGFMTGDSQIALPTNRAARFIQDGEGESMFFLLASMSEPTKIGDGPVLPSLRSRSEAERENMVFRPLLEEAADRNGDLPVVAYGNDTPASFGLMTSPSHSYSDELDRTALANLAEQAVEIEDLEVGGIALSVVTGSYYATEKLLEERFMRDLHRKHGETLAVIVPRRGIMFVTNALSDDPTMAPKVLSVIADRETQTSRTISRAILLVRDGQVVGYIDVERDDTPPPPKEKKQPSFFRRLLGRA